MVARRRLPRLAVRPLFLLFAIIPLLPAGSALGFQGQALLLPESLKLSRLIDLASQLTGQSYTYNAADVGAITVTLRVPGGLTRDNLPLLLDHILASRGYTTVRTPGSTVLSVVKLEQAAGLARVDPPEAPGPPAGPAPGPGPASGPSPGFITELIQVKHVPVKSVIEAVKVLLSKPGGAATPLGDSKLIAVSDLAPRVADVKALIERLDQPEAVVTRDVPLSHISATQATALATLVIAKREAAGAIKLRGDLVATPDAARLLLVCPPELEGQWRELISTLDQREPAETRT